MVVGGEERTVKDLGVEIRYNTIVGKDVTMSELRSEFDALFIGVGAHGSQPMGVSGEDKGYAGFIAGVKYLLDINMGKDPYPEGKKVVVAGGGNVAMDCVRSSFRIGKSDVHLVYRRSKAEMPADPLEVRDAEEEGVTFHYLCNPIRIIEKDGKVAAVECIRMELGEPDKSGRRRPVPVPGSEFIIETDILIPAIGQAVDLSFLGSDAGVELTKWKTVLVDQDTFQTSQPGIFSAGDCETGPDVLVRACGNGKRAAWRIDQYLQGKDLAPGEAERFNDFFAKIKVFQKDEDLGVAGGEPRCTFADAQSGKEKVDVRRGGGRVQGRRGDERGRAMPEVLSHRHGSGLNTTQRVGRMVRLKIDGKEVETNEGKTILDAARENGIYIPTLCFHENLLPLGSCRMCVVEADGYANPMAACTTAALEGMSIHTQSDRLLAMRQDYLKLILAYHPLDCPICDAGGECDLQDLVFEHRIEKADLSVHRDTKIESYATPLIRYSGEPLHPLPSLHPRVQGGFGRKRPRPRGDGDRRENGPHQSAQLHLVRRVSLRLSGGRPHREPEPPEGQTLAS